MLRETWKEHFESKEDMQGQNLIMLCDIQDIDLSTGVSLLRASHGGGWLMSWKKHR